MPAFAALYAVVALLMVVLRGSAWSDPLPWMGVCFTAAALGAAAFRGKHLVMLSAAHAGLTATWAGAVAASMARKTLITTPDATTLAMLLTLCLGMAVLVSGGLRRQPEPLKSSRP